MFPLADDRTGYRLLDSEHVSAGSFNGGEILKVAPEGLTLLAQQAFTDVAHLYRPSHLKLLAGIFEDPES
jgi:fumarate hydratase class I